MISLIIKFAYLYYLFDKEKDIANNAHLSRSADKFENNTYFTHVLVKIRHWISNILKTLGGVVSLRVLDLSTHLETYYAYDCGEKRLFAHQTTNSLRCTTFV